MDNKPIDIFITAFERQHFLKECIEYIIKRTTTPYRITVLDNGGNDWVESFTDPDLFKYGSIRYVPLYKLVGNTGIHFAWNVAVSLAESKYFITTDPDLLVPDLKDVKFINSFAEGIHGREVPDSPDWLERMIGYMEARPDYGAISMCPHVFIGAAGIPVDHPDEVLERNMCGAVFRIMDTDKVRSVRGWDLIISAGRNHEERTICSRLQEAGYKTGICSRVRAYHNFGKNWGYPEKFTPAMQKHNPELEEYVQSFDKRELYDPKTWLPV